MNQNEINQKLEKLETFERICKRFKNRVDAWNDWDGTGRNYYQPFYNVMQEVFAETYQEPEPTKK